MTKSISGTTTAAVDTALDKTGVPVEAPRPQPFMARDLSDAFDYLSMLIYGDFGVGKTYFAGTSVLVPEYRDILYLSLEGGEKSLRQILKDCKKKGIDANKHILVIPIQTYKQYANIYEFLKLHVKFRDAGDIENLRKLEAQIRGYGPEIINDETKLKQAIPEPKQIQTVITDSLTEAQKYCMYQILGIDPLKQRLDLQPDSAQWADWGASREMIQFLVRRLRDLPVNSIFICGQDIEQDTAKKNFYTPLLPGKLAADVRGLVEIVGYYANVPLEGGKVVRRMFFVGGTYGNANIAAKHRFGDALPSVYVDDISMEDIRKFDTI